MPAVELLMVTATVPDLDGMVAAWTEGTEYELVDAGAVPAELEVAWGTAPGAHPRATVTRAPGSSRGFVRFVAGGEVGHPRPIYEVRGPMAIEFFARDAAEVHARFAAGSIFQPLTEPVDYDLTAIGSGRVQSVGLAAAGGPAIFVSTMKWVPPPRPLPTSPHFLGPAVNVPIVALDRERSNAFYSGLLGIPVRFDGLTQDASVNRVMLAPPDLAFHITVFFIADGQMAEHHFHDPARIVEEPPAPGHLRSGVVGSTYRVTGFDAILEQARAAGHAVRGPVTIGAPPYAGARLACLTGPNGELVELLEA